MACFAFLYFQAINSLLKIQSLKGVLEQFLILYIGGRGNRSLTVYSKSFLFQVKQEHFPFPSLSVTSQ